MTPQIGGVWACAGYIGVICRTSEDPEPNPLLACIWEVMQWVNDRRNTGLRYVSEDDLTPRTLHNLCYSAELASGDELCLDYWGEEFTVETISWQWRLADIRDAVDEAALGQLARIAHGKAA